MQSGKPTPRPNGAISMWYRLGYFVPGLDERRKGAHKINRWCIISGPHYRRSGTDNRKELTEELAASLAKVAHYELESVISVDEKDLPRYKISTFPWLLMQSTFWGKE